MKIFFNLLFLIVFICSCEDSTKFSNSQKAQDDKAKRLKKEEEDRQKAEDERKRLEEEERKTQKAEAERLKKEEDRQKAEDERERLKEESRKAQEIKLIDDYKSKWRNSDDARDENLFKEDLFNILKKVKAGNSNNDYIGQTIKDTTTLEKRNEILFNYFGSYHYRSEQPKNTIDRFAQAGLLDEEFLDGKVEQKDPLKYFATYTRKSEDLKKDLESMNRVGASIKTTALLKLFIDLAANHQIKNSSVGGYLNELVNIYYGLAMGMSLKALDNNSPDDTYRVYLAPSKELFNTLFPNDVIANIKNTVTEKKWHDILNERIGKGEYGIPFNTITAVARVFKMSEDKAKQALLY